MVWSAPIESQAPWAKLYEDKEGEGQCWLVLGSKESCFGWSVNFTVGLSLPSIGSVVA